MAFASQLKTSDKGKPLTEGWWRRFKKRHSSALKLAKPEGQEQARAASTNEETINHQFDLLEGTITKHEVVSGYKIWNVDVKGFTLDPLPRRVIAGQDNQHVYQQHRRTADHITTNICVNAAGQFLPPQIICSRRQVHENLTVDGPDDALYSHSDKGSMNESLFRDWFMELFLPNTRRDVHHVSKNFRSARSMHFIGRETFGNWEKKTHGLVLKLVMLKESIGFLTREKNVQQLHIPNQRFSLFCRSLSWTTTALTFRWR